jgi:hypothetical protein
MRQMIIKKHKHFFNKGDLCLRNPGLVYGAREDAKIIVKEICKETGKLKLTKETPQY